jgi:hypothetical protein
MLRSPCHAFARFELDDHAGDRRAQRDPRLQLAELFDAAYLSSLMPTWRTLPRAVDEHSEVGAARAAPREILLRCDPFGHVEIGEWGARGDAIERRAHVQFLDIGHRARLHDGLIALVERNVADRFIGVPGVDRKTIRRYARESGANSPMATGSGESLEQIPPPRPPAPLPRAASACEPHRAWIEEQVALGRNAAIHQELVERHDFAYRYDSVKRFVRSLKRREPERFDVLERAPGEEAQVDFGLGALTLAANGKYRRPFLFVMTLKYSGKRFRKVVWKADQETWARLHEEGFRTFGGAVAYVVLDNLKQVRAITRTSFRSEFR